MDAGLYAVPGAGRYGGCDDDAGDPLEGEDAGEYLAVGIAGLFEGAEVARVHLFLGGAEGMFVRGGHRCTNSGRLLSEVHSHRLATALCVVCPPMRW